MRSKRLSTIKLAGMLGLLSAIIFFICIGLSIHFSPWFSWTENWLSEMAGSLGETPIWAARGISSITFNVGLIIAGIIGILFAVMIRKSRMFNTCSGYLTTFILFIDMSALCGIGVFPITVGGMHLLNAMVLFALIPMLLFITGYALWSVFGKKWWWLTNILCCISVCSVFIFMFTGAKAVAEMIAFCCLFAFLIALSIKFLSLSFDSKEIFNRKPVSQ